MATSINTAATAVRNLFKFLTSPRLGQTFPLQRGSSSQSSSGVSAFPLDDPADIDSDGEVDEDSDSLKTRVHAVVRLFLRDIAYPSYTVSNIPRGIDMGLVERVISRTSPWVEGRHESSKWARVCEQSAAMADVSFSSFEFSGKPSTLISSVADGVQEA